MARYLTDEEKKFILQDLPFPKTLSRDILEKHQQYVFVMFYNQMNIKVYPQTIPLIKKAVEKKYIKSLAEPGSPVGFWASQTMESITQDGLSSFHTAGLEKNLSAGLTRLTEIYNASQSPKIICFQFIPREKVSSLKELQEKISLNSISMKDLIQRYVFVHAVPSEWEQKFALLFDQPLSQTKEWSIEFFLDPEIMLKNNLTCEKIVTKLNSHISSLSYRFRSHVNPPLLKVIVDMSNLANDAQYLMGKCIEEEYLYKIVLPQLEKIHLSGIPGVELTFGKETPDGWVYEGNGGTLISLLSHPDANPYLTRNDNIWDIYEILGLEATIQFLIGELRRVKCENDVFIHPAHISLIVRHMTQNGYINAINRHGMSFEEFQALSKIAFEECLKNSVQATIQSEVDETNGIDGCLMTGKVLPIGSGMSQILVDLEKAQPPKEAKKAEMVYF